MMISAGTKALSMALLLAHGLTPHSLAGQERGDIAVVGGLVVDPASGLSAVRNVLIQGDRIVAITDRPVEAVCTIDARGLVVAPGFIDLLAHMRPSREPQQYKIKDGVTTVVSMHGGPVDIDNWYRSFEPEGSMGRRLRPEPWGSASESTTCQALRTKRS